MEEETGGSHHLDPGLSGLWRWPSRWVEGGVCGSQLQVLFIYLHEKY